MINVLFNKKKVRAPFTVGDLAKSLFKDKELIERLKKEGVIESHGDSYIVHGLFYTELSDGRVIPGGTVILKKEVE